MDHVKKANVPVLQKEGLRVYKVFGADGYIHAEDATEMYIRGEPSLGKAKPHRHGAEVVYIADAKDAVMCCGSDKEDMQAYPLAADDTLYLEPGEWHCFDFMSVNGFVDAIAFFPTGKPEMEE